MNRSTPRPSLARMAELLASLLALCVAPACGSTHTDFATTDTDTDDGTESETAGETTDTSAPELPEPNPNAKPPGAPPLILRVGTEPAPLKLTLDKAASLAVFGEDSKKITLIEIDSTKMLENALSKIQNACGSDWDKGPNPQHDCSSPETQAMGFPVNWKISPEFALVRLLTLTPANADLRGTELGVLQSFVNENPDFFPQGFAGILAETLGFYDENNEPDVTRALLPLPAVLEATKKSLLASHPHIDNEDGVLRVTLHDALHDMTPLQSSDRFGPQAGGHPGVLLADDDDFLTRSDALTDEFRMTLTTSTRHRRVDGIDLSANASGDMFIVHEAGPALAFDFDNLEISGLAEIPTIDMRLQIHEVTNTIQPCAGDGATQCYDNAPCPVLDDQCSPTKPASVWGQDPWALEYFAALAGYIEYNKPDFEYYDCFVNFNMQCGASAQIGSPANAPPGGPPGWTKFHIGSPFNPADVPVPEPQYFWELLVGIADTMFHDPDGDGSPDLGDNPKPTFTFKGLGLGIDAEQLVEGVDENNDGVKEQKGVKDFLSEQEGLLADIMVGQYWRNNFPVDFYMWRESPDAPAYLFFANEEDLRPDPQDSNKLYAPNYLRQGFFSCPELTESCKLSTTTVGGVADTSHQKLKLEPGRTTVYVRDDNNRNYEVGLIMPDSGDELVVEVTAR